MFLTGKWTESISLRPHLSFVKVKEKGYLATFRINVGAII